MGLKRRNPAIFLVATCFLAGGAALQAFGYLTAGVAGSVPFAVLLSGMVGMTAAACAAVGAVRALSRNEIRNPLLHLFAWMYCVGIGYGAGTLAWQPLTFSIVIGGATLRLGPDFVGIVFLSWYYAIASRGAPIVPLAVPADPVDAIATADAIQPPAPQPVHASDSTLEPIELS